MCNKNYRSAYTLEGPCDRPNGPLLVAGTPLTLIGWLSKPSGRRTRECICVMQVKIVVHQAWWRLGVSLFMVSFTAMYVRQQIVCEQYCSYTTCMVDFQVTPQHLLLEVYGELACTVRCWMVQVVCYDMLGLFPPAMCSVSPHETHFCQCISHTYAMVDRVATLTHFG